MFAHDLYTLPLSTEARQGPATVLQALEHRWLIAFRGHPEPLLAARAASCLLEPSVGDEVWIVESAGRAFVTAILERASSSSGTVLKVDGDLKIQAGYRLELEATSTMAVHSESLEIEARRGRVVLESIEMALRSVYAYVCTSTIVAKVLETIVERVTQHCNTSYRAVAVLDHVTAGTIDYRAQGTVHVHGHDTMMSAAELTKIDAGQIHLG